MLKHGEINPLNIHGLRQLEHCPPHFEIVQFDNYVSDKDISDWVYENLSGRFYVGHRDIKDGNKSSHRQMIVGFELSSEATYFSLFLPQINTAPVW